MYFRTQQKLQKKLHSSWERSKLISWLVLIKLSSQSYFSLDTTHSWLDKYPILHILITPPLPSLIKQVHQSSSFFYTQLQTQTWEKIYIAVFKSWTKLGIKLFFTCLNNWTKCLPIWTKPIFRQTLLVD